MTTDQNKKIIQRLFSEAMTGKNLKVIDEIISEKFTNHGMPNAKTGPAGFKAVVQQFLTAFPDMQLNTQGIIAEGDSVATRGIMTGTHNGEFMGIPSTGKKIKIEFIDYWKLSDGKAIENWVQMDIAGLMQQIGVMQHAL